jgi:hypothetical protein
MLNITVKQLEKLLLSRLCYSVSSKEEEQVERAHTISGKSNFRNCVKHMSVSGLIFQLLTDFNTLLD